MPPPPILACTFFLSAVDVLVKSKGRRNEMGRGDMSPSPSYFDSYVNPIPIKGGGGGGAPFKYYRPHYFWVHSAVPESP